MPATGTQSDRRLRIALLSDVHGNAWALEAVLADVGRHRPDRWVLLGDLLADGPDPVRTLELLRGLPDATFVQGNTDRYLADLDQVVAPRSEMSDLVATWRWAVEQLGDDGCGFLASLPAGATLETPVGGVLVAHGVPGDDEGLLLPTRPDTWAGIDWGEARLLLVGHTHAPFVLELDGRTVVNPGSIGLPEPTGWRASYAIVDLYAGGQIAVQHAQVTWDIAAYVTAFAEGIPMNRKAAPMLGTLRRRM